MQSIEEMIAIVQIYIMQRKDKEVQIAIQSPIDLMKLTKAYNIANNWLIENNANIKRI
jgi:hypothetical protein